MRFLILLVLVIPAILAAQIDCDVTVNFDNVPVYKEQLQNFKQDIETYINSQRWTNDDLGGEKIKCTMNIFFVSSNSDNSYQAQAFIGSQRPIFIGKNPSSRSTPMLRIFDDKWEFTYLKGQPLYRNETQYDALTDFIDYYMYLIMGFDYDSYEKLSGTPFFQKSMQFCAQAPSSAKGWDRGTGTTYSKYQLVDDILNPKNQPFREGFYFYHLKGLDLLATKPEIGYKNMISLLNQIGELKNTSARQLLFKTFFETKYGELADVFKGFSDKTIYLTLVRLDQAHQNAYEEAAKK
jgi:hypothetical protein